MTKELEIRNAKRAVINLQKAAGDVARNAEAPRGLYEALTKQLHRAQAKLAELTGSTEP